MDSNVDSLFELILDNADTRHTAPPVQSRFLRRELKYIDHRFHTARELSDDQLREEVDNYHNSQPWYSRITQRLNLTKAPPRIRAYKQALTDRCT